MIEQPYSLINHMQGAYRIPVRLEVDEHLIDLEDWEMRLESVGKLDPITVTIADLIEIVVGYHLLDE